MFCFAQKISIDPSSYFKDSNSWRCGKVECQVCLVLLREKNSEAKFEKENKLRHGTTWENRSTGRCSNWEQVGPLPVGVLLPVELSGGVLLSSDLFVQRVVYPVLQLSPAFQQITPQTEVASEKSQVFVPHTITQLNWSLFHVCRARIS
ncbi:hypothetical protein RRG08_047987 [Elysia crispata]|uniref:Uncharacterized protein n=1 Tax=Elysia crispata TaxID=231223 RepID=A0AAE1DM94_9GAST|nr:hypothetical protein RRG08_047987 [Elysia crispata]